MQKRLKRGEMIYPKIDDLLTKVDSKFTLVIEAAKRARELNDYFSAVRRRELPRVSSPRVEVSSQQPLTVALEEIAQDELTYEHTRESIK